MRRLLVPALLASVSVFVVLLAPALAGTCTSQIPMGGIAPQRPIWCELLQPGTDTHVEAANAWSDDFDHGQSFAQLNPSYIEGFLGNGEALHFQHNNHWMLDVESGGEGALIGAWMRPNRTFQLQPNGWVVVEFEVAGPIAGTRDGPTISDSWPELVITTAPQPPGMQPWGSAIRRNGTYLYEAFPGYYTFGCRMQQSRHPICAYYINDFGTAGTFPSRQWEINQNGGDVTFQFGGDPSTPGLADVWKGCNTVEDPDTVCRNKFRWEIKANEVKLYTNGVLYYHAGLIDSGLNNILLNPGGFYVFNGDFAYRMDPGRALRFHWDHLAVNPELLGGGPAPTPTPTQVAAPTATPVPTNTPTAGGTTVDFNNVAGQNRVLAETVGPMTFPSGQWWLSGPWGALTTKSVSFTSGRTSSQFSFSTPRQVASFQAYNGGDGSSTVSLTCGGTKTQSVPAGALVTITTGLSGTCSTVTMTSSNGWDTNFDNFVITN
jgi:hypothetical protein